MRQSLFQFLILLLVPGAVIAAAAHLFTVAQIVNLLYRRLPIGWALLEIRRPGQGVVVQDGILRYSRLAVCAASTAAALNTYAAANQGRGQADWKDWQDQVVNVPYSIAETVRAPVLRLFRQDYEQLERNRSVIQTPLTLGQKTFAHGLGTHSISHIRVVSPEPIIRFSAWVGVDLNDRTRGFPGSVEFSVAAGDQNLFRSEVLRSGQEPLRVDISVSDAKALDLRVGDGGDGPACDHADWAEATITTKSGKTFRLDEMEQGTVPYLASVYPFSFSYGELSSDELLKNWQREQQTTTVDENRTRTTTVWADPKTGLRVHWELTRFADFPALEWVLDFENSGAADTPILKDIQALDQSFSSPLKNGGPYRLHKTKGAPADPTDFEPTVVVVNDKRRETLGGGGGRPSNKDFPFFKIETGKGSLIIAVGWSGQWQAQIESPDKQNLHVTAGLEKTHFLLHPGERVRTPRMLELYWMGDTLESNAQFRQLIYRHYAANYNGRKPLPVLFSNTCFTRGGGWLNECNAQNQISLINAYAPLGLEAVLTDAGWFEGGWPAGAGNWNPRQDAYPDGMGPVAAAAKQRGMIYGLWFEPERVVKGTALQKNHPDWILARGKEPQTTYLLNFGLPQVQEYFFNIVKGFMELPGFRFYRQDFNMDPLEYWRYNDPPDRQGITESKYIEGLYAYWDRIARTWPDGLREECASGGRRIDLETIQRMHLHQESDYWFDNETDQNQIWGLGQYLPNNLFDTPLIRLDDYSFHSTLATSLIIGWIADAPDFDARRGRQLLDRYRAVRHLLVGAWYPLLPYSRSLEDWMASQYHRPDLNEGLILVFRRAESPYGTVELALHDLDPSATYEVSYDSTATKERRKGAALMDQLQLALPKKHQSELIVYRKIPD